MKTDLGPILTAVVTPFDASGAVDFDTFRAVLRHLGDGGSDGVVVCGTTGESPTLSDEEKLALFKVAVDEVGGSIKVVAGTGTNDTAHSVRLTQQAVALGVDAVLVVTPYYNKPPREGLVKHFTAVARAAGSVDVIVYNIPGRVILNLEPDLLAELAQIDNVVAVKEANPDIEQARATRELAPDLAIYAGNDDTLMPLLELGAVGGICVSSHVVGREMRQVVELFGAGNDQAAREVNARLQPVYEALNVSNPIPVKAAMQLIGYEVGPPRLPLVEATPMQREQIRGVLERAGVLDAAAV